MRRRVLIKSGAWSDKAETRDGEKRQEGRDREWKCFTTAVFYRVPIVYAAVRTSVPGGGQSCQGTCSVGREEKKKKIRKKSKNSLGSFFCEWQCMLPPPLRSVDDDWAARPWRPLTSIPSMTGGVEMGPVEAPNANQRQPTLAGLTHLFPHSGCLAIVALHAP